jgi:hypothetical protein
MTNTELTEIVEIKIDTTLPTFTTNLIEIKVGVEKELKKYDIKVNTSNLAEAKQLASKLNFFAKKLNEKRIEKQKEASVPIENFKKEVDEVIDLFTAGRQKLLSQIKVFEDEKKRLCLNLLQAELEEQYKRLNVKLEYQTITIDDLAILSNLTDTDNLTKKAKNEVINKVNQVLLTQTLVNGRLTNLEGICVKAGLTSPLEKRHIESFLKEPDNIYNVKLQSLIETEVKRQKEIKDTILKQEEERLKREAEAKVREEMQRQAQVQVEIKQALVEQVKVEPQAVSNQMPVIIKAPKPANILDEIEESSTKQQKFIITAFFEIECKGQTSKTLIEKYRAKLQANFQSLKEVNIKML